MSVVIETTIGDFTVDLFLRERPRACQNFLKLCKLKYYNFCLFHTVQRDFIAQTGDPEGTGKGGTSLYGILYGEQAKYFEAEKTPKLKHQNTGTLSFASHGDHMLGSQFFLTLGEQLEYLDGDHCVFGQVVEGLDVLLKLNAAICDDKYQPYQDIRITHTVVLDDPLDDPAGLEIPDRSPPLTDAILNSGRIAADEDLEESAGRTAEELEELIEEREARARATILEMVGDLPDADSAPPENVLFVCKLNPVTTDDDLQVIFSRFGKVVSCEIIRDQKTGNSLQYGFIEFDNPKSCENAYFKMDNVLIDDRRIHVDFSQSVSKVKWRGKGRITYESGTAAGDLANMGGGGGRRDGGRGQRGRHRGTGRPQAPRPAPGRPAAEADSRPGRPALAGLNVGQLKALLGDGRKKRDGSGDSSDDNRQSKKSKKHKKGSRKHSSDRNDSSEGEGPVGKEKPKDRRRRSPHSSDQRLQRKEAHDRRRSQSPDARSFRKQGPRDKKRRSQSPDVRTSRTDDSRAKRRRSPSPDRKWSRRDDSRSKNRRSRSPAVGSSRKEDTRSGRRSPSPDVARSRRENSRDRRDRRRTPDPDVRSSTREDRDRRRRSPDPDERERVPRKKRSEDRSDKTSHKKKKHKSDEKARKKKKKRRRSRSSDSDSSSDSSSGEDRRKKSSRRR